MADVYSSLASVLEATEFPDCDLALRRGRHIDSGDAALYSYLKDAQDHLEIFYRRFGCDLVFRNDGYYYLLPTGDKLRKKHLSENSMLVGQALALLYLDPTTVQVGGVVDRDQLLSQLDGVLGTDALIRAFNPKRRRYDERVAQGNVRKKVSAEVRRLASLGFVELLPDNAMRLRPALLRFAEPVRGLAAPAESLAKLVASGEVVMRDEGGDDLSDEDLDDGLDGFDDVDDVDDVDDGFEEEPENRPEPESENKPEPEGDED
ncbi:MAG: chromosome partition protein MukE [Kofleriaceae bacterium]|nr:chromosome partition protein MukE [Kofleriaceae bacterium]